MAQRQNPANQPKPFESDTQRLVHRHLSDPNHVITEEELAGIRIGMTPPPDTLTQEAIRESEDHLSDQKSAGENEIVPGEQQSIAWGLIS